MKVNLHTSNEAANKGNAAASPTPPNCHNKWIFLDETISGSKNEEEEEEEPRSHHNPN